METCLFGHCDSVLEECASYTWVAEIGFAQGPCEESEAGAIHGVVLADWSEFYLLLTCSDGVSDRGRAT
jgi:hypothetical protein